MVEDCWWTIFVEDVEVGDVEDGKCLLKKKEELEKKSKPQACNRSLLSRVGKS